MVDVHRKWGSWWFLLGYLQVSDTFHERDSHEWIRWSAYTDPLNLCCRIQTSIGPQPVPVGTDLAVNVVSIKRNSMGRQHITTLSCARNKATSIAGELCGGGHGNSLCEIVLWNIGDSGLSDTSLGYRSDFHWILAITVSWGFASIPLPFLWRSDWCNQQCSPSHSTTTLCSATIWSWLAVSLPKSLAGGKLNPNDISSGPCTTVLVAGNSMSLCGLSSLDSGMRRNRFLYPVFPGVFRGRNFFGTGARTKDEATRMETAGSMADRTSTLSVKSSVLTKVVK